jgi:hypothetical protein
VGQSGFPDPFGQTELSPKAAEIVGALTSLTFAAALTWGGTDLALKFFFKKKLFHYIGKIFIITQILP